MSFARVYGLYAERLRRAGAVDFDDLLVQLIRLFRTRPDVADRHAQRIRWLLVDEYQDTNPIQYALIRMLAARHRNVCCVGDEDQSIYAFRGADIRNILDFERDFKDATIVKLEQNHRSTRNILAAATAVIRNNANRHDKTLWTENAEGPSSSSTPRRTTGPRPTSSSRRCSSWYASTRSRSTRSACCTAPTRPRGCSRTG
jgi:DNA helicase-2/ATP-dependent DNA helicase PcrA